MADLWRQVHDRVHSSFEALDADGLGPCIAGPPCAAKWLFDAPVLAPSVTLLGSPRVDVPHGSKRSLTVGGVFYG